MGAGNGAMTKIIHKDGSKHLSKHKKDKDDDIEQINQHNHSTVNQSTHSGRGSRSLDNITWPTDIGFVKQVSQKKPSSGPWAHKQIHITKLKAWIDKRLTTIDDTCSGVLKYKTPHFRAFASIEIPALDNGERFQVGWIQVCSSMVFTNTYGSVGITSWEFPEITLGKYTMISDADGKLYPWYGARRELKTVKGPCDPQVICLEMNDNFFPQVTWHVPSDKYGREPKLTHIHRKQHFYTCLALKDINRNHIYIYKTITWNMELNIGVDPEQPLGQRAKLIGPLEQEQPKLLKHNIQLPVYSLRAPNANRSQVLIWRPMTGEPQVIVPPLETTVDMDKYAGQTKDYIKQLTSSSQ